MTDLWRGPNGDWTDYEAQQEADEAAGRANAAALAAAGTPLPTAGEYAEWDRIALAIQGTRTLAELSEAEKATVVAIRAMGPDAAAPWVANNAQFASTSTKVWTENGLVEQSTLVQTPADAQYWAKVQIQNDKDARDATAILTWANGPGVAGAPPLLADLTPATVGAVRTLSLVGAGGGDAAPAGVSSVPQTQAVTGKNVALVVLALLLVLALAMGWISLPSARR